MGDNVEDDSVRLYWWSNYQDIAMHHLLDINHLTESTRLSAVLLNIRKNDKGAKQLSVFSQRLSRGQGATNGYSSSFTLYDRIFLFGVVGSQNGACFAVLTHSSKQSMYLLAKFSSDSSYIGRHCILIEPSFDGKTLGRDNTLPILSVSDSLEPYIFETPFPVPFNVDLPFGSTNYFMLYNTIIRLDRPNVAKASCCGVSCDRLLLTSRETSCCCLFAKCHTDLTVVCRVIVRNNNDQQILDPVEYRSKTLTDLLIGDLSNHSDVKQFSADQKQAMRDSIHNSVDYVNEHGGWDVCGWARRGAVVDAADQREGNVRGEEVASDTINPHIISLTPSNNSDAMKQGLEELCYRIPCVIIM